MHTARPMQFCVCVYIYVFVSIQNGIVTWPLQLTDASFWRSVLLSFNGFRLRILRQPARRTPKRLPGLGSTSLVLFAQALPFWLV